MNFETIAAISTAYGTAGISVIRVSGDTSISQINQIFKGFDLLKAKSHTLHYGHIINDDGSYLDEVMVAVMKAPKTFTAEDVVEISTHGGILITQKVLERILSLGIRLAEPGEFTKLAFQNNKIDLLEAESIGDLIHSETELQREQAVKLVQGNASNYYNKFCLVCSNLIFFCRLEFLS